MKKEGYSIIVSAYKSEKYIKECLDSISNQTFFKNNDDYEILLGIDSCKKTLEKIEEIKENYKNLKVFYMLENVGTYITCNTLLNQVNYDKIIRFDSDDIMCKDMIETLQKHIIRADVIRIKFINFSEKITSIDKEKLKKHNDKNSKIAHGVVCFRWKVFETLGGYMPWRTSADTEILKRTDNFFKHLLVHRPLFFRRNHNSSLTNNNSTGFGSEIRKSYKDKIKNTNYNKLIFVERQTSEFKNIN
jgi:glycosyltransferase involved in cell wall biosynthesis